MLNLPALLLDAADKATAAQAAARAALAIEVAPPSQEQVDAVLVTLPAWAERTMREDPGAGLVTFLPVATREEQALAEAVATALRSHGVNVVLAHDASRLPVAVTALRVDVASLIAAGAVLREQAALDAFALAWRGIAGESATVYSNTAAATLVVGTSSLGSGGLGGDLYTLAPGWQARPVADLVEEARRALRLPLWTLDALTAAWQATTDRLSFGGPATVDLVPGYHRGTLYRPVPAVAFLGCESGPLYLDTDDARDLTAEQAVAKVIAAAGLDVAPSEPPATTPTGNAPPLTLTGGQPHLTRGERRRLAQQGNRAAT